MLVYSRRQKSKGVRKLASEVPRQSEPAIAPEEPKDAEVVVVPEEIEVYQEIPVNINEYNDLDVPIAHRK